jgi:hypothetical protein
MVLATTPLSFAFWADDDATERIVINMVWSTPLSGDEKINATNEIAKLEPYIRRGQLNAISRALLFYQSYDLPLPE